MALSYYCTYYSHQPSPLGRRSRKCAARPLSSGRTVQLGLTAAVALCSSATQQRPHCAARPLSSGRTVQLGLTAAAALCSSASQQPPHCAAQPPSSGRTVQLCLKAAAALCSPFVIASKESRAYCISLHVDALDFIGRA